MSAPAVLDDVTIIVAPALGFERLVRTLGHKVGLDRAIAFTVLARGWGSLAGLLTVTLIAHFLSPAEQGYYYVFYSLVALQMIFELGFSVVILQTASHECAHLTVSADGVITGSERAHGRLASVFKKAVRWYLCGSILLFCTLIPAGFRFFKTHGTIHSPGQAPVHWVMPWLLVVAATVFTFQVDPIFSFLEGCGFVPQVARSRFFQAVAGSLLGWSALLLRHGLFAPGMIIVGQALVGGYVIWQKRRLLLPLLRMKSHTQIHWGSEIWPFQWRVAVSWVCGYFIFQLFTPVLFASSRWGPVEAGRMGMTISVAGALSAVSISWMNTKASPFGRLIALKKYAELDRIFFRSLLQSTAINLVGSACVWFGAVFLLSRHVAIAQRVLPPLPFGLFLMAGVLNNIVFGFALYLRAHKREKFMVNAIFGAIYGAAMVYLLGRPFGALGITSGYLAGAILIGIVHGGYTFVKYRRLWHDA